MRVLFATTSAAVLAMMVGTAPAGALTSAPAAMRGAVTRIDVAQNVARVCRDVCNDMGFCRRRCWNEPSSRAYDDDEAPPRVYDRRRVYEAPPGVGIYGPGIGIELGPRW
jgi:hypothetical protein